MTNQITLADFWMGRDQRYAEELTDEIRAHAEVTVKRINTMLLRAALDGVPLVVSPKTGSLVASGWRPPEVNAATRGAAKRSRHMTGEAGDVYDPAGKLSSWCLNHLDVLEQVGLWLEFPGSTPGWCHVQIVPPGSGRRVFHP